MKSALQQSWQLALTGGLVPLAIFSYLDPLGYRGLPDCADPEP
jgi:hypothetical protein